MFIRIVAGNAAFAALVWGWWLYTGGNREWVVAGTVLTFAAFVAGLVMGLILAPRPAAPRARRAVRRPAPVDLGAFDRIA